MRKARRRPLSLHTCVRPIRDHKSHAILLVAYFTNNQSVVSTVHSHLYPVRNANPKRNTFSCFRVQAILRLDRHSSSPSLLQPVQAFFQTHLQLLLYLVTGLLSRFACTMSRSGRSFFGSIGSLLALVSRLLSSTSSTNLQLIKSPLETALNLCK